ncbi:hypothetical protein C0995_003616 [Termitomyces sp. Mi166|nr:hypothetical protein C0995_003616 [Termitomyces sp. Mi166\
MAINIFTIAFFARAYELTVFLVSLIGRFHELPQPDLVQFAPVFIVMFAAAASGFVVGKFSKLRRKTGSLKLERPPKRLWIIGLLLIVCPLTFKLSHRLPALDIICSIALSRIRTKLHISLRKIITYLFPPLQPPPFFHANFVPWQGIDPFPLPSATEVFTIIYEAFTHFSFAEFSSMLKYMSEHPPSPVFVTITLLSALVILTMFALLLAIATSTYDFRPFHPKYNYVNTDKFASDIATDDLDSHHDDPEVNDNLNPPFGEYVSIDSISEEDRQHTVTIPRREFEGLLSDFKTAFDDAQSEIRELSKMIRDLMEQNTYLEEENRSLSGVVEIPPDYNQAVEEGAFDEWSAAVVSGVAAFAPPRQDVPPIYNAIELGDPQNYNMTGIPTSSQATRSDSVANESSTSRNIHQSQMKPCAPIVSILSSFLFFSSDLELSSSENTTR